MSSSRALEGASLAPPSDTDLLSLSSEISMIFSERFGETSGFTGQEVAIASCIHQRKRTSNIEEYVRGSGVKN